MYACPCFIAVLHSPGHADVLRPFETIYEAIDQAHAWLHGQDVAEVPAPGYVCWLTTADAHTYARVESHVLALAEPEDDEDPLTLGLGADTAVSTQPGGRRAQHGKCLACGVCGTCTGCACDLYDLDADDVQWHGVTRPEWHGLLRARQEVH